MENVKINVVKKLFVTKLALSAALVSMLLAFSSCNGDDDKKEITGTKLRASDVQRIDLSFRAAGADEIITTSFLTDPQNPINFIADDWITLSPSTTYTLKVDFIAVDTSINEVVINNADRYLLFFEWDRDAFTSPQGNGNLDNRSDELHYLDFDRKGLPLGLETQWSTGRQNPINLSILLQDQVSEKSNSSSSQVGSTILKIQAKVIIE